MGTLPTSEDSPRPVSQPRTVAHRTAWLFSIPAVIGTFLASALVANSAPYDSTDTLGLQNVLAGWAGAGAVLLLFTAGMTLIVRRHDAASQRELARVSAWIFGTPAVVLTLFLAMLALGSGGSEDLALGDVAAEWAVLAAPLLAATAGLIAFAHRR